VKETLSRLHIGTHSVYNTFAGESTIGGSWTDFGDVFGLRRLSCIRRSSHALAALLSMVLWVDTDKSAAEACDTQSMLDRRRSPN